MYACEGFIGDYSLYYEFLVEKRINPPWTFAARKIIRESVLTHKVAARGYAKHVNLLKLHPSDEHFYILKIPFHVQKYPHVSKALIMFVYIVKTF